MIGTLCQIFPRLAWQVLVGIIAVLAPVVFVACALFGVSTVFGRFL